MVINISEINYKIGLEIECQKGILCGDYQNLYRDSRTEREICDLPYYKEVYKDGCRDEVVTHPFDEAEFEKVIEIYGKVLKKYNIRSVHVNISSDELDKRALDDAAISMMPPGILYLAKVKPWELYNEALELPKNKDKLGCKNLVSVRTDTRLKPCVEIRWPRDLESAREAFYRFKENVGISAELPDLKPKENLDNWYRWVPDWEIFRKEYPKESEWLKEHKDQNIKRHDEIVCEEEKLRNTWTEMQIALVKLSGEIMDNLEKISSGTEGNASGYPFCSGINYNIQDNAVCGFNEVAM